MSDTRAAMREFRFLDEKRTRGILSPAEEARWNELREHLVAQEMPSQDASAMDPAQQPQGYYGDDGQWYAYPAGYDPNAQAYDPNQQAYDPNAQAYDPNAYAQQPQGYYGADGQWYAYPAGYDPNAQAYDPNAQGYDPNAQAYDPNQQAYDPNAQAYAGYDTQGYESQPTQEPYPAEPQLDSAADPTSSQPTPAYASPVPGYVPQRPRPMPDPVKLSLESENLEVPALNEPAPWEEPAPEPIAEPSPEPEPLDAEPEPLDAEPSSEDVFEVSDTDVSPVSEATPIPENVPESVDMSDWNDVTTPSTASLVARQQALAVTNSTEVSGPVELGEDDFSSLNSDLGSSAPVSAPPVAEPAIAESRPGSQRTIEISASDIELLESDADVPLQAEPMLAEEPAAPATDEWASAPLALDAEPVTAPSQPAYDAGTPDLALLEDGDRMEITASYAIPATPATDANDVQATADATPTFDVSELQAAPEPIAAPALETPWETSPEDPGAYGAEAQGGEQPTFDVGDLGAEVEPVAPASDFPSSQHVTTLELNPVQVAPDLHADTVEVADSFDPEASRTTEWGVPENAEQAYDAGSPDDAVPLSSAADYLGHGEQGGTSVSDEAVPLETTGAEMSWSETGSESTGEGLQLESAAEYMSTPQFAEASATWGHQPEGEQPAAEMAEPESTTAYGHRLGEDAGMELGEAQPEWAASEPAPEQQPVLEAQPEWSTAEPEPAAPAEPQPEWAAPAEEQPVMEAQPEWSAPVEEQPAAEQQPVMEVQAEWAAPAEEQPIMEAQSEWSASAEEQPVMEAQPEWSASAEQPVMEAQPEWSSAESQPLPEAQTEWSAPAEQQPWMAAAEQPAESIEPQPEWAPGGATQDWNAEPTAEPQAAWNAPVEEAPAQTDWNAGYAAEPAAHEQSHGYGQPQEPAWGTSEEPAAPAEQYATPEPAYGYGSTPPSTVSDIPIIEEEPEVMEAEPELPVMAMPPPAPPPEPELPVMEAEPEMPEIDLSEDIVEPPPVAVPVAVPPPAPRMAPAPVTRSAPPPAPVAAAPRPPPAPVAPPSLSAMPSAPPVMVPGAPPPRPTLNTLASVQPARASSAVPMSPVDAFIAGEHRVIIHTVEGQVKRGAIRDVDLLDEVIPLEQQTGFAPERIPTQRVKAVFFMLATGSRPPQPEGQKVRVTFTDGRQVAGFSHDYKGTGQGFFVIPADTRTNTSRIFIYRASVQAVAEG